MKTRAILRNVVPAAAAVIGALAVGGCQNSSVRNAPVIKQISEIGVPTVTVENNSNTPVQVSVWTTERDLEYAKTWENMYGRSEMIDVGRSARFVLTELEDSTRPLVRFQVRTRGASFEPTYEYWFESVSQASLTAELRGTPSQLEMTSNKTRIAMIPETRVLKDQITRSDDAAKNDRRLRRAEAYP
ncbi:MAG: hypothetical protein VYC34_01545 [Planctomycetota bacterium]|nr:hypothetical protein [Planctomycetota bacterium]